MRRLAYFRSFNFKMRRFLKRNERRLPFLGAFIVFTTFIVKDGIGDHVKDTVEGIRSAVDIYNVRRGPEPDKEEFLRDEIDMTRFYDSIRNMTPAKVLAQDGPIESEALKIDTFASKSATVITIDEDFIHRLPYSPQLNESLIQIEELHRSHRKRLLALFKERPRSPSSDETSLEVFREVGEPIADEGLFIANLGAQAIDLGVQAEVFARDEIERKEKEYTYTKWTSYALYGLGWTLGLLGKLYGVPDAVSGE